MNIMRFYNQNRKRIWRIILIIITFYVLVRLANRGYAELRRNYY